MQRFAKYLYLKWKRQKGGSDRITEAGALLVSAILILYFAFALYDPFVPCYLKVIWGLFAGSAVFCFFSLPLVNVS